MTASYSIALIAMHIYTYTVFQPHIILEAENVQKLQLFIEFHAESYLTTNGDLVKYSNKSSL